MATLDLLCGPDGDLLIENGDFVIGPSDQQHNYDIMASDPGDWKEYPLVGFGPNQYLNSRTSATVMNQNAKIQLQADNCEPRSIRTDVKFDTDGILTVAVDGKRI